MKPLFTAICLGYYVADTIDQKITKTLSKAALLSFLIVMTGLGRLL